MLLVHLVRLAPEQPRARASVGGLQQQPSLAWEPWSLAGSRPGVPPAAHEAFRLLRLEGAGAADSQWQQHQQRQQQQVPSSSTSSTLACHDRSLKEAATTFKSQQGHMLPNIPVPKHHRSLLNIFIIRRHVPALTCF